MQLFAVDIGQLHADLPEAGPSLLGGSGLASVPGRDVQGFGLAVGTPSEVEVGAVTASGIGVARTRRLAAGAGSGRESALNHGVGEGEELTKESVPTLHTRVG